MIPGFRPVTARNRCPVCGKPDWCLVRNDGAAAICPRTISAREWGDAGFFHIIDDAKFKSAVPQRFDAMPPTAIDAAGIHAEMEGDIDADRIRRHAAELGVTAQSLAAMGIGWSSRHDAFAFPMRNCLGQIIGIRLRNERGDKWAVNGSRNGIFIPSCRFDDECWIVEGPTDTAAALSIGLPTIGRPSATACVDTTVAFCRRFTMVNIVGDYDDTGQLGATKLANALVGAGIMVRLLYPRRGKDMRQWVVDGATHEEVRAVAANTQAWSREAA